LEMDEDELVSIILGRPFLATARAVINFLQSLPQESGKDAKEVRGNQPCVKLRKMPFHGKGRNRPWVISKLPYPTNVKAIQIFLGHAGFYRSFIKDFSQVARPMTQILVKDAPFNFSEKCIQAFDTLKRELIQASIMIKPEWSLPFEIMCDASDYAVGAVLGQRINKHFKPIHYANKTMNKAQKSYINTEKELLAVVFAFEKSCQYLPEMKQHKFFDSVTVAHQGDIMALPLLQGKSSRSGFTGHMSFAVHVNWSDLDTMSLDDLYNHLKVYESEVQKKSDPNSHNMAFISYAKHSSGNKDRNTACVSTTSTIFPTASASDINQIDEDDMEEMDIKWSMALQNGVGWDWSYMENEREDHTLVTDEEAPKEFALMANTSTESKSLDYLSIKKEKSNTLKKIRTLEFYRESNKECIETLSKKLETLKLEKDGLDGKLAGLLTASKDLGNLIESQRSEKNKEGLGYTAVPPLTAQLYLSPKKDLSWTGLPECADDTVIDYSRPSPTVESTSEDNQNKNSSASEDVASPIIPKPFVKFVKPKDCQSKSLDFVMKKKACFNCGDFTHLANNCRKRVKRGTSRSQNNAFKSPSHRPVGHRPYGPPVRPMRSNMSVARTNRTFFNIQAHSYETRPFLKTTTVKYQFRAPWVPTVNRNNPPVNGKFSTGCRNFPTANRKFPTASRKFPAGRAKIHTADMGRKGKVGSSQNKIDDKGYWDSGCSRHMIGNISYLSDFEPYDGGYVYFGQGGCKITGKGTIKMGKLEFENVYFVKDLKYNLFSVSQIYDNKNNVLFTDSECIVLGRDFKLLDDANILLRTPRQHNMYSINLNNIVPHRDLTCLVAKASADECILWHRRLGHLNFKTMNKLVRHNLVRGLPTKCFENDHTCTACLKGKQHKSTYKSKLVNSMSKPLHNLHMDLFGPTSESLRQKEMKVTLLDNLCLAKHLGGILKKFITEIENLKDLKVKIIRCDNEGEFRNKEMNDFCSQKGIKREFSNARTPQQNGAAERRNRTLIEAARTMVLVNKSHNKTPYELFNDSSPAIEFLKPFGCHVMILNTLDNLGKFEEKGDEGYFIGYSMSNKAFRVFNKRTRRVEENLHVEFLESKAIEKGSGPNWLFDINSLTKSMNYMPVDAGTISTSLSGTKDAARQEDPQDHCSTKVPEGSGNTNLAASTTNPPADQMETLTVETPIPTVSSPVPSAYSTDSQEPSSDARLISKRVANQADIPSLDNILSLTNWFEDILGDTTNSDESNGEEADINDMETVITASLTPTLRIHKDHPKSQIIGPMDTPIQTRNKSKEVGEQSFIVTIHQKTDPALLQFCLFSCFLYQVEPKKIFDALQDPSWVEAMQEELL
nr:hypothetical protein [Tanacetum cinerariifolium]